MIFPSAPGGCRQPRGHDNRWRRREIGERSQSPESSRRGAGFHWFLRGRARGNSAQTTCRSEDSGRFRGQSRPPPAYASLPLMNQPLRSRSWSRKASRLTCRITSSLPRSFSAGSQPPGRSSFPAASPLGDRRTSMVGALSWRGASGALSVVDAQGPVLLEALEARPGLIKPNRSELAGDT